MEQVSKAVEKKIQEYLEKPSKFTSGESTDFHNYLTKEKGLTKSQANSIVTGIECCNKKVLKLEMKILKLFAKHWIVFPSVRLCAKVLRKNGKKQVKNILMY